MKKTCVVNSLWGTLVFKLDRIMDGRFIVDSSFSKRKTIQLSSTPFKNGSCCFEGYGSKLVNITKLMLKNVHAKKLKSL